MTLKEAITIAQNKLEVDYTGKTEKQVEELDEAIEMIFEAAIKYSELQEQKR